MTRSEEIIGKIKEMYFLEGNVLTETKFRVNERNQEMELCDGMILLGSYGVVFQIKERGHTATSPIDRWFEKRIKKAKDQISKTIDHMEKGRITIKNNLGEDCEVGSGEVSIIGKIIIHHFSDSIFCSAGFDKHIISSKSGFIHILSLPEFILSLSVLVTAKDFFDYLEFREWFSMNFSKVSRNLPEFYMLGRYIDKRFTEPDLSNLDREISHLCDVVDGERKSYDYRYKDNLKSIVSSLSNTEKEAKRLISDTLSLLDKKDLSLFLDRYEKYIIGENFKMVDYDFYAFGLSSGRCPFIFMSSEEDSLDEFKEETKEKICDVFDQTGIGFAIACSYFYDKSGNKRIAWAIPRYPM